ncbi:hypothetical protein KFU94_41730 [Chloroflexi bacterium TSY]|nr:hypothetical protein [Chloroflexi bacterium TSY]
MKDLRSALLGCLGIIFSGSVALGLLVALIMMLFTSCTQSLSQWRQSAYHVTIAQEQTNQVQIQTDGQVQIHNRWAEAFEHDSDNQLSAVKHIVWSSYLKTTTWQWLILGLPAVFFLVALMQYCREVRR